MAVGNNRETGESVKTVADRRRQGKSLKRKLESRL